MFRLGFASDLELTLMPQLIAVLRSEAPGVRVVGHLADPRDVENALDEGRLDLALGCFNPRGNRLLIRIIYQQELRCVWPPDQLPIKPPLTRSHHLSASHVADGPSKIALDLQLFV
ncbi:LysR substrate-binding domain-containing protein [Rhizobium sp. NFR03]|uniref:LysR substrate-binding domain-containing protein n=1 Tax=Rhizobium sp. NFR03 TaxID=1566263 RepID=UPI0008B2F378|nr:LysR substrate-binding domain-containing protein [Rhizobium sp. NFR03]SES46368.1 LysR substrate binding domain-containing protein [Rhizobium sp. NFR03]